MERIKSMMDDGIAEGVFPGGVILAAQGGRALALLGVGMAAVTPKTVPIRTDTIFDLASLTKVCATALAVMKLVDVRTVGLDQSLSDLLPSAPLADKGALTPRMLLSHSAGLPDWRPFFLRLTGVAPEHRKAVLREWIVREPFAYTPGTGCLYSDLGFMLLQWVIEEKTHVTLNHYVEKTFYRPLGLKRTLFMPGGDVEKPPRAACERKRRMGPSEFAATEDCPWRKRVLQGEVHDENSFALGGCSGHAGLFSTAEEVFGIANMLREHYRDERQDFFRPETVREFWRRQDLVAEGDWALGWDTRAEEGSSAGRYFSRNSVGHTGFTGTSIWIDPAKDVTVILLANRVHPSRENPERIKAFRPRIHDAIMEELGMTGNS
ncbi:MAG: serine hydrolase [Deltaproteobacteria bacterium]|nr:serine hydrolase [Deltaproteobacteria bacterium]